MTLKNLGLRQESGPSPAVTATYLLVLNALESAHFEISICHVT